GVLGTRGAGAAGARRRAAGEPGGRAVSSSLRAAGQLGGVDVHVAPEVAHEDVAVVADDPGLGEVGPDAVHVHLVRHVGDHQLLGLGHHRHALGAVGHALLLLVEAV